MRCKTCDLEPNQATARTELEFEREASEGGAGSSKVLSCEQIENF